MIQSFKNVSLLNQVNASLRWSLFSAEVFVLLFYVLAAVEGQLLKEDILY